jgi:hypothetical protein
MRLRWMAASLVVLTAGCSDGGACAGTASCAYANTEWSHKACDCVPVPADEVNFWSYFAADYEWVEHHATLKDAVAGSDAALLGKLTSAAKGVVIQGDAIEDVYTEVDITVEVIDPIHGDALAMRTLQLTLPPPTQRVTDELLASMNGALPVSPVLLILRKRESGKYRVVHGYGLWAQTIRGAVDAPLVAPGDLGFVAAETAGHRTVEQLAKSLQ